MTSPLAEHVGGGLQHLVGRAHDLGVHLIGALGGDQVGDFGHHLDIGLFEIALLDVAIDGGGFLVVQTPAGERYTRDGALQIDNQGRLVTAVGNPVLGNSGPIVFQPTDHDISIAADGNVTVVEGTGRVDSVRGKLRLVSFAQAQQLLKEGSNLYSAGEGGAPQADTTSRVRQGYIEKSNVNSVSEMSRMIEVSRTYTQISALLQQQSDLHRTAIEKLADVPA